MSEAQDDLPFKPASKRMPMIITGVAGFFGGALLGALITAASMGGGDKTPSPEGPVASASASAAPPASASAAAPAESLTDRARKGDKKAIEQLEGKAVSERTSAEALALAEARATLKRQEIEELARKIELVPKLLKEDKDVKSRVKELLKDKEVAPTLLEAYAKMKGPVGPDLLYLAWNTRTDDDTDRLAEELLYSKDVRKKASSELSIVLDMRSIEDCDAMHKVLERAKLIADRRALVPMAKLFQKRGCGEKKIADCWPCLRDDDVLKDAAVTARKNSPPPPN